MKLKPNAKAIDLMMSVRENVNVLIEAADRVARLQREMAEALRNGDYLATCHLIDDLAELGNESRCEAAVANAKLAQMRYVDRDLWLGAKEDHDRKAIDVRLANLDETQLQAELDKHETNCTDVDCLVGKIIRDKISSFGPNPEAVH